MNKRKQKFFKILLLIQFMIVGSFFVFSQQDGEDVTIGKYRVIHSNILNEDRILLIHLPRGYEDGKQYYPVVYMLYGDHVTTYFAEAVSILDTLGPTGRIPDCILVAVMNTNRYRDLLPLTPDGKPTGILNFTRFLQEEVFPFIEKNYRVKHFRMLIGPQAGANFGLYTLFEYPDLFSAMLLNNPFRWQGGRDIIMKKAADRLEQNRIFKKFVFITYDDTDALAREGIEYIERFSAMLKKIGPEGFVLELNFIRDNDEFLQRLGIREGIKSFFRNYPFPEDREVEKLDDILAFYRQLSKHYGFEVDCPEHVLTVQGDRLLDRGKASEVIALLKYTMEKYPRGANSYFRMANMLSRDGRLEEARDYLRKAMDLIPHDSGMLRSRLERMERQIAGSASYRIEKAIRSAGIAGGLRMAGELKAKADPQIYFDEREFNDLGYRFMQAGKPAEALEIFKLTVELYPDSANAYDSLGEAYMKTGDKVRAIESYKKSLQLNPQNENAKKMLEQLEK